MTRIKITGKTQPQIKHIGKTLPRLDPEKIAKALGADQIMTAPKQAKDGRNYREIVRVSKNKRRSTKRIYELDEKSVEKYAPLGITRGEDFFHCVYLGGRHTENFWERVCGYCFTTSNSSQFKLEVTFYEKKQK